MSEKRNKTIYDDGSVNLQKDVAEGIAEVSLEHNVVVPAYYDMKDEKLVLTEQNTQSDSLIELPALIVGGADPKDLNSGDGSVGGKVTIGNLIDDDEKPIDDVHPGISSFEEDVEQADEAILRIHNLEEVTEDPVWVSVYTREDYHDRYHSTEETGERTTRNDKFNDLGEP